jgi:hypothetical protein
MDDGHQKRLYIVKNLINGKVYGGKHFWFPETKYMGSGYALKKAFKKYGKENFRIRWLKLDVKSSEHLDKLEIRLIRLLKYKFGNNCYNIQKGGCGGYFTYYMNDEQKREVFKKISEGKKKQYSEGPSKKQIEFWNAHSAKLKQKYKYEPDFYEKMCVKGNRKRIESLKKRRETQGPTQKEIDRHKKLPKYTQKYITYKLVYPNGEEFIETKYINDFITTYKTDWNIFVVARNEGKFVFKRRTSRTSHPFPTKTELYILHEIMGNDAYINEEPGGSSAPPGSV